MAASADIVYVLSDLTAIPDNFSISFLPQYQNISQKAHQNISQKAQQKGLNYYLQGYVHDIKIFVSSPTSSDSLTKVTLVSAKCWRSMRKNDRPHNISFTLKNAEELIEDSHCSCKAG